MHSGKNIRNIVALLLGVGGAASLAMAAESANLLDEQVFFDELPVVVTVTRLPQNYIDVPASVTVIDRRMIEASGVSNIPDLLRLVAGFQVAHVAGNRWSATYHGMSDEYARRLQVLVDGRSIYSPDTGGVDWANLPLALEDIDRIEVLRGPNGVTYGANSFVGVINIITQHPSVVAGVFAKVEVGEREHRRGVLRYGGRMGDLDYRLTLEQRSDDGFDDTVDKDELVQYRDDRQASKVTLRGEYRAGINDYLSMQLGANIAANGYGYYDDVFVPDAVADNWNHYQQLKWRHVRSSDEEFELQFYHNYSDTDSAYKTAKVSELLGVDPVLVPLYLGVPDQRVDVDFSTLAERYDLEFQHRLRLTPALRLVWGAEARFDQVISEGYLTRMEPVENRLYRLFTHGEWRPAPDWLVNAGVMAEHNDFVETNYSPRLSLSRYLNSNTALRVSYTTAYRTPAVLEEYADHAAHFELDRSLANQEWWSHGGLDAERISAWELGLVGRSDTDRVRYDLKLFREELRDLIATPIDLDFHERFSSPINCDPEYGYPGWCQATVFENMSYADVEGFEAQVQLRPEERLGISFGFSQAYATGWFVDRLNPEDGEPAWKYVPSTTLSLLVDHRASSGWETSVGLYQVSNMKFWAEVSVTTMDLRLAKRFKSTAGEGSVALVARDIGGEYYDFQDYWVVTPSLYLMLEYKI